MRSSKHQYSLISDANGPSPPHQPMARFTHAYYRLSFILVILLSFGTGGIVTYFFQILIFSRPLQSLTYPDIPPSVDGLPAFPYVERTFSYNRTFGADPAENKFTEDAWDSLVPLGQGTVRSSNTSSQVYTLSVMHQLHCLWSIHQSFYTILHKNPTEADMQDFPHIRHCFDYIRQALMCSADTSLEPVDLVLGGVTGWNGTHICRDFSSVARWSEHHRTNNLRGFRDAHEAHGAHGHS
ncbi:hypothetical protein F5Y18DRAFT_149700 [Xylariaceae sp. FL1019]|nr:hypothetical protein F5Y18DRAFT_149700 [Xylariaceae sp. FL1019]